MGKLLNHERIKGVIKNIDTKVLFISFVTTLIVIYYINPLKHIGIDTWDRSFSSAVISGIDINKRIKNFVLLFILVVPINFMFITFGYGILLTIRKGYKNIFFEICVILVFPIAIAFISRYSSEVMMQSANKILLVTFISFLTVLVEMAILDKNMIISSSQIYILFAAYLVANTLTNILLRIGTLKSICIMFVVFFLYIFGITKTQKGGKLFPYMQNLICLMMWIPFLVCALIEYFYYLNEKDITISHYYTNICIVVITFTIVAAVIVYVLREKGKSFLTIGYVGMIISLSALKYFSHAYQYIWSYLNQSNYSSYSNLYEMGNGTVAADTILSGKVPVVDYFSAHALSDVWTKILYCFIHSDINGIFVDPYGGLTVLVALLILFYIMQKIFNKGVAMLFVSIYPFLFSDIKAVSICFLTIALLVRLLESECLKLRMYVTFWCGTLLSAFMVYDEGMTLGIASILAYIIILALEKKWRRIKQFIFAGTLVGSVAFIFYFFYCWTTGLSVFSRIKEWISVSLGSNTTWAIFSFGDVSSFAFLVCYFIVPTCAVGILSITIIQFMRTKSYPILAGVTIAFAIAEILYIPRGIVFHNLYFGSGKGGVLLNFIHYTISFFVLYELTLIEKSYVKKVFSWLCVFSLMILGEGAFVTGTLPTLNFTLYAGSSISSENIKLSDDMSGIKGQKRIVCDTQTSELVDSFQRIFDALLEKDETFLDFANITSLYSLTGKQRPFYVGQSPSLLTDLYSQKCFINEISRHKVPLAVLGTTDVAFTQQMILVPHNIRYYTVAEYIYSNFRPLVLAGDFAIWCEKENYDEFKCILEKNNFIQKGYEFIDYGYDVFSSTLNESKNIYYPYHQYDLGMLPYIWANNDKYHSINNEKLMEVELSPANIYKFEGSQSVDNSNGNYIVFECTNFQEQNISMSVTFMDSKNEGIKYEYDFTAIPGVSNYMIRVSQDYFWNVYNIDNIIFTSNSNYSVGKVWVLKGD